MLRRAQSPAAGSHGLRLAQLPAAWFSGCVGHGRRQRYSSTGCVWAQSPAAGFHGPAARGRCPGA
eukprot:6507254-Prymnesium_polylepis.1